MTLHDSLWNYNDPAATAVKFRELLATLSPDVNLSEYLQLQTQLARTQSLQRKFDEAHAILDEVEPQLSSDHTSIEHVRYHLERGRTYNSSGDKVQAKHHFDEALKYAQQLAADFYIVDALHMLAIVASPDKALELNTQAIAFAEESSDSQARGWLGSLYNNTGWALFEKGEYTKALEIFERSLAWREEKQHVREAQIAKWTIARTLRALQRYDEALTIQLALLEEGNSANRKDGYVYEELAELYALSNDDKSSDFASIAYELLSADEWLRANEPARLVRLRSMGNPNP